MPPMEFAADIAVLGSISENGSDLVSRLELNEMPNVVAEPGWRDMLSKINVRGTGTSSPTWSQLGTSPFWAYRVNVNQEFWCSFHVPHDFKLGSSVFPHVHFTTSGTSTQPIVWQYDYTIAKGHDQSNFNIAAGWSTITSTTIPNGTAWRHYVSEVATPITSSELEPDSLVLIHVKRITNGGTDNANIVYAMFTDLHYMADRVVTKNRAPNFYA